MKTQVRFSLGRRQLFRAIALGAAASAAPLAAPDAFADSESNDEKRKARYRESEEVKSFYRVNRYPK